MNRRLAIAGAAAALSLAFGCAEIYGLGDYTEGDASVVDVMSEPLPVYDGGCACAPSIPTGWTPIAYDQAFRSNCATNYGNPVDVNEGITADPATCGCSCGVAMNCNALLVTSGDSGTCNNQTSQNMALDGGCATLTTAILAGAKMSIKASGTGSCTPDASVTKPSPSFGSQGRLCELLVAPATEGCTTTGICVPSAAPFAFCVHQDGVATCPAGYPAQHVVGTNVNDGRGCSPCTCDFDAGAGCGGSAALYVGAACSAGSQPINADGTCQTVTGNQSLKSLAYQATTSASCAPSQPTPTGTATFADSQTVCCTQ